MTSRSVVINAQDPSKFTSDYVDRMRAGGVTASVVNIAVYNPWTMSAESPGEALIVAGRWLGTLRALRGRAVLGTTGAELRAAAERGEVAVILGFQGVDPIDFSVDLLDVFYRVGARVMQFTYNGPNRLGDGCYEPRDGGITTQGRRFVGRMNELGIVIDLSHVGRRTTRDVIDCSADPVIFSHANAAAVYDNARNLTDEQIKAVVARGGMIGLSMFPPMLARGRHITLDDLADHARYIADLVGPEHLGLGLDFPENFSTDDWRRLYAELGFDPRVAGDPPPLYPTNLTGIDQFGEILETLERRGFSRPEVEGIAGLNFLRVFERIWGS